MENDIHENRRNLQDMFSDGMEDEAKIQACQMIEQHFKGQILTQTSDHAQIEVPLSRDLAADRYNMTYTGFLECIAQYTALLLTNDKRSIVVQSESEFLTPVKTGLTMTFDAKESYHTRGSDGNFTQHVKVVGRCKEMIVYESTMMILTLNMHPFYKPDFMNSIDGEDSYGN